MRKRSRFGENFNLIESVSKDLFAKGNQVNEPVRLLGKVWVEDGQLYCQSSPTYLPMVTVTEGVKFYKNQQLVKDKTSIVTESDVFQLQVENEEKETKWNISIEQQKLKSCVRG